MSRLTLALCAVLLAANVQAQAEPVSAHVHVLDTLPVPTFDPEDITIRIGDSVDWDNHANRVHTVTHSACPRIDSRLPAEGCAFDTLRDRGRDLDPAARFSVTFDSPGIFDYVCAIHRFGARITVLDEAGTLPDLVVDSVAAHETPLKTSKRIEAILGNDGAATANTSRLIFEIRPIGASAWNRFGDVSVAPLSPGQRRVINQDLPTFNKLGDFEIRVTADGANSIVESEEANNSRVISVSIWTPAGTVPGIALPDTPAPQPLPTQVPLP